MSKEYINNIKHVDSPKLGDDESWRSYWLKPLDRQQKSFYRKAEVIFHKADNTWRLYSYETCVLEYSPETGKIRRWWSGWSKTTAEHIKAFLGVYIPKRDWEALPCGEWCLTVEDGARRKREKALGIIKTLAMSQGFYGRLLRDLIEMERRDPERYDDVMDELAQHAQDPVSLVLYLES